MVGEVRPGRGVRMLMAGSGFGGLPIPGSGFGRLPIPGSGFGGLAAPGSGLGGLAMPGSCFIWPAIDGRGAPAPIPSSGC